ncbi:MAG: MarR family transcriptional regulator [Dehalococcoidia bacterium]|jgi:DNA-binding MarR family transcriptional regulator
MTESSLPADREEWAGLYAAFAILRKESERALSAWRLTVPQAAVLALLAEASGPLPITRLARLLLQESPSITTLVDRMCASGLVKRTKDPNDRRLVLIQLTAKGRHVHDEVRSHAIAVSDEMFGVLTDEERIALRRLLQKFGRANVKRLR